MTRSNTAMREFRRKPKPSKLVGLRTACAVLVPPYKKLEIFAQGRKQGRMNYQGP
jgi:hypothetical protein